MTVNDNPMTEKNPFQQQTKLTTVRIEHSGNEHHLKFETDTDAIQSAINMKQPHQLVMQNLQYLMGILQFIPEPKKILILGVGGGSLIHFFRHYLPNSEITGVEYNAELMNIAFDRLKLPRAETNLSYVIEDARHYIKTCEEKFDLIVLDIFDSGVSPDWSLHQGFNRHLKNRLTPQGAVAYNLLIQSEKGFSRFYQLMRELYQQQTLCLETEDYENILVYALNFKNRPSSLTHNLQKSMQFTEMYDLPFNQIMKVIYDINPQGAGII